MILFYYSFLFSLASFSYLKDDIPPLFSELLPYGLPLLSFPSVLIIGDISFKLKSDSF
jgi:hypothetical protein